MFVLLLSSLVMAQDFSAETLVLMDDDALVGGAGVRLDHDRSFLGVEGRGVAQGRFTGRATVGLDWFEGCGPGYMTTGLFLGTMGDWQDRSLAADPTAGFEFAIGFDGSTLKGRWRHANGFKGPLEEHFTENDWRLGFAVFEAAEVFGQYTRYNPGQELAVGSYGVGARINF